AATALTGAAGPLLGGLLVDVASWRAAFLLAVPLALVALAIGVARVPDVRIGRDRPEIDWRGIALASTGLAALVLGLTSPGAAALAAVGGGLALLVAFIRHEMRAAAPMMPLRLFRSTTFLG